MLSLIGVAIVIVGFAMRFNPLLVVVIAGIVTGFAGGRPAVEEIIAYWPALVAREKIEPGIRVEML